MASGERAEDLVTADRASRRRAERYWGWGFIEGSVIVVVAWAISSGILHNRPTPGLLVGPALIGVWKIARNW